MKAREVTSKTELGCSLFFSLYLVHIFLLPYIEYINA
jgi:hypothetical protein